MPGELDESLVDEVRACIASRKNPDKCIDKVLENHGIDPEKKASTLAQVIKRIDTAPPIEPPKEQKQ